MNKKKKVGVLEKEGHIVPRAFSVLESLSLKLDLVAWEGSLHWDGLEH